MKNNLCYFILAVLLFPVVMGAVLCHRSQMRQLAEAEEARRFSSELAELSWRIFLLSENYRSGCRLRLREYQEAQAAEISRLLRQSRQALPGVREKVCGTGNSLKMMYRLLHDGVRGTERFREYCSELLAPVTAPCAQAENEIADAQKNFRHLAREARIRYLTELALFRQEMGLPEPEEAFAELPTRIGPVRNIVAGRMQALISVTLEGIFIRDTLRIMNGFFLRGTAAAGCTAADGPLPVGDFFGLGLAVWGIGEAAADFQQARSSLPDLFEENMRNRLFAAEQEMLHRVKGSSEALTEIFLKESEQIELLLQKQLKEK